MASIQEKLAPKTPAISDQRGGELKIMKLLSFVCMSILALALSGCSKKGPQNHSAKAIAKAFGFDIRVVQTAEAKEQAEIRRQALALLTNSDFDALEALAQTHRTSKEAFANGMWKLYYVYDGLAPSGGEPVWQARLKQLQDWGGNKPDSVTARVALARFWAGYAWKARGSGAANSVTEEGWRLMGERLQKCVQVLREAGRMKERCPILWSSWHQFALGNEKDKDEYKKMFEQAIAEFPDYEPYYNNRAIFLLPRWYGEEGEWVRDLTIYADQVGGEKGDMIYAQVVWNTHLLTSHLYRLHSIGLV